MFNDSKYTKWYMSIVNSTKNRVTDQYTETHHIIPKSLGGSNDSDNLVELTAKEHYVCHMLLVKMLDGENKQKMVYAWWQLSNQCNDRQQRIRINGNRYALARKYFAGIHSDRMKKNHPLRNPENLKKLREGIKRRGPTSVKGRKMSEDSKQKLRDKEWTQKALDNRLQNCLKAAEARKGSKWSEEHHANRFNAYVEKNKHLFPQVLGLYDSGLNIRQVSLKLNISWERAKYIIDNRERLQTP